MGGARLNCGLSISEKLIEISLAARDEMGRNKLYLCHPDRPNASEGVEGSVDVDK